MDRARRVALSASLVLLFVSAATLGSSPVRSAPGTAPVAAVGWPPSSGLLIAEVVTGGGSASDEYVEITNGGPAPVDLVGLELVYATSSGTTVTRKATWQTSRFLDPGQHLVLANALGAFASGADGTYGGGLAATGGALALRVVGGAPVDAIGWGDATNGFVEGAVAPAPPPRSSLERRPGGLGGNVVDTNDNATDWLIEPAPSPQNLSASPAPALMPSPTPAATDEPAPTVTPPFAPPPTAVPTRAPNPTNDPGASPANPQPTPGATLAPPSQTAPLLPSASTAEPTAQPQASVLTGSQDLSPTPAATQQTPDPSPLASPDALPIAAARALPDGSTVTIEGVLTTDIGALESGRASFVQDATGGIGIYLDAAVVDGLRAGSLVRLTGEVGERYGARTLRADAIAISRIGDAELPEASATSTGAAAEGLEGRRIVVAGIVAEPPSSLADGTGLLVDDGSGPLRVVVTPAAIAGFTVFRGTAVMATGPLGQRDSSGTGATGYRVYATRPGELVLAIDPATAEPASAPPSPIASGSEPGSTGTPTPSKPPSPHPTGTPGSTPSASPTIGPVAWIATARGGSIGARVHIRGTVTAEPGRISTAAIFIVQDATGAIAVRVPGGAAQPSRGAIVELSGTLAAPYGQLEIRPGPTGIVITGIAELPSPRPVAGSQVGEANEAVLVTIDAAVDQAPRRGASGDVAVDALGADGARIRIMARGSSGITTPDLPRGARLRLTGIVGQRASVRGRLDGYRIWLRDRADIVRLDDPTGGRPTPAPGGPEPILTIAAALISSDRTVRVEGIVTADPSLLDASGQLVVIQDATAAIEVRLPKGVRGARIGERLLVSGAVGRAYGAPRIAATDVGSLGRAGAVVAPLELRTAPGTAHEWRLVRVAGVMTAVHRLGARWSAEIAVGRDAIVVVGMAGAGIPSTALQTGRRVAVTGIVRRPYPSAVDRRFAVLPRSTTDLALGPVVAGVSVGRGTGSGRGGGRPGASGSSINRRGDGPLDVDLGELGAHVGTVVRVGGLVVDIDAGGFTLDDGTARGRIALGGEAAAYLTLLEPGDPVNAVGVVGRTAAGLVVSARSGSGITRVGDLGETVPLASPSEPAVATVAPTSTPSTASASRLAAGFDGLGGPGIPTVAGLGSLLLVSAVSIGFTFVRRRRVRRALAERIATRLAAVTTPPPAGPEGGPRTTYERSTHG